ncbi:MAG: hypothetical protein PHH00_03825 [Candidatus Nanoarchaeia archaeon]|nr:hypothetical protein [Candidatus Nanoarchaeia archaeon]
MEQPATAKIENPETGRKEPPMYITFADMRRSQFAVIHAEKSADSNGNGVYYDVPGTGIRYSYDEIRPLALMRYVYEFLARQPDGEAKFEELSGKYIEDLSKRFDKKNLDTDELDVHIAADLLIDFGYAEFTDFPLQAGQDGIPGPLSAGIRLRQKN